ncbi:hypothetical protein BC628DRAFT_523193 [Trametes gibbosa]|nr:hypothetical protein BC628DRAFT_523193 [Trametes gibbosa]
MLLPSCIPHYLFCTAFRFRPTAPAPAGTTWKTTPETDEIGPRIPHIPPFSCTGRLPSYSTTRVLPLLSHVPSYTASPAILDAHRTLTSFLNFAQRLTPARRRQLCAFSARVQNGRPSPSAQTPLPPVSHDKPTSATSPRRPSPSAWARCSHPRTSSLARCRSGMPHPNLSSGAVTTASWGRCSPSDAARCQCAMRIVDVCAGRFLGRAHIRAYVRSKATDVCRYRIITTSVRRLGRVSRP